MARLIQVTNVSPLASAQNVREIFSYLGDIEEIKVYPEREDKSVAAPAKVGYIKFKDRKSCDVALHLTNTVFLDRALIVVEANDDNIPSEDLVMQVASPASSSNAVTNGGTATGTGLLPTPSANTPDVISAVPEPPQVGLVNLVGQAVPPPPPITGNVDPTKIEEIRRTIYVGNLNTNITADQVMSFFHPVGEVKYVRMAGDETQPTRFAFVEFADQASVPLALQYNGAMLGDRPIKVNHSKNAIVKPQAKHPDTAQREMEEAMKKVMEAQQLIDTAIEPAEGTTRSRSGSRSQRRRTRSRSKSRGYGRSKSPRRRRSRSPYYRRSRYSRSPRKRSRSPRRRSWSRSPRRRSRSPRRRSRSPRRRSRSPRRRSRSPRRRSRTPRRRSRSPRRRSRTPRRRSRSPRRRSRSPRRRPYSPKRHSRSPRPRSRSPKSRSRSPKIHKRTSYSPKRSPSLKKQSPSSDDQSPIKATPEQVTVSKEYLPSPKEVQVSPKSSVSPEVAVQKHERSPLPFEEQMSPELSPQPNNKRSRSPQSPERSIEKAHKSSYKSLPHQDANLTPEKGTPGIKLSPHKKHKKRSKRETSSSPKPKKHKKHKHHERENSKSVSPVCDTGSDKKRRKSKKKRSKHSPHLERSPDVLSDS